jgi:polyisoprenoid-binding protein YceI
MPILRVVRRGSPAARDHPRHAVGPPLARDAGPVHGKPQGGLSIMKVRRLSTILAAAAVVALVAALPALALAAEQTYSFDPSHSSMGFRVRHLMSKVAGNFGSFTGELRMDPADLAKGSVSLEIDASSIDTANEKRDGHLKSADFFAADSFPKITFKSTKVTSKSEDHLLVDGLLTMRGVTKPVTLDVVYGGMMTDPWGNTRTGFDVTGKVNRKDFGILWNKTLDQGGTLLGEDVDLVISIEAVQAAEEPAAGKGEAKKG